eukprot:tig00020943_g16316.t1
MSASQPRLPGQPIKVSSKPKAPAAAAARAAPGPKKAAAAPAAPAAAAAGARAGSAATAAAAASTGGAGAGAKLKGPAAAPIQAQASHAAPGPSPLASIIKNDYRLPPDRPAALEHLRDAIGRQLQRVEGEERARAPRTWREARVFVSSTFKDMQGERNHLNKIVFPRLNAECGRAHRVRFVCIDLRWGLTAEDTSVAGRGAVLLCLDEIARCRPWFLCLLGGRYGWVPPETYLPYVMKDVDLETYKWLRLWPQGDSVTELEIMYGLLGAAGAAGAGPGAGGSSSAARLRAFAFHRDPSFVDTIPAEDAAGRELFAPDNAAKQADLRARVAASPLCKNFTYKCSYAGVVEGGVRAVGGLAEFGQAVFEALSGALAQEAAAAGEVEDGLGLGPERAAQRLFMEMRAPGCLGRDEVVAAIVDFAACKRVDAAIELPSASSAKKKAPKKKKADGEAEGAAPGASAADPADFPVLLVTGGAGSGKSSVMARAALALSGLPGAPALVVHFVGATEHPATLDAVVERLEAECRALAPAPAEAEAEGASEAPEADELGSASEPAFGAQKEAPKVAELAAAAGRPVVLCLDAINQIEGGKAIALGWRLGKFGGPVRLVASCVPGEIARGFQKDFKAATLSIPKAGTALAGEIVNTVLADVGKKLTEPQLAAVLAKKGASSPLYLRLLVDELIVFGVFEQLDARIASLPGEAAALLGAVLERLEAENAPGLAELSPGARRVWRLADAAAQGALSLVACSQGGLSEPELLLALSLALPALAPSSPGRDPEPLPRALWSPLYNALAHLLRPASAEGGVLSFFHRQVQRAVRGRYLAGCPHEKCETTENGDNCSEARPEPDDALMKGVKNWDQRWAAKDGKWHQVLALMALRSPRYLPNVRHHLLMSAPWRKATAAAPALAAGMARLNSVATFRLRLQASRWWNTMELEGAVRGLCQGLIALPSLRKVDLGTPKTVMGQSAEASVTKLTKGAASYLAGLVRRAPHLRVLDLSRIGMASDALGPLAEAVAGRPGLTALSLSDNDLFSDAAPLLLADHVVVDAAPEDAHRALAKAFLATKNSTCELRLLRLVEVRHTNQRLRRKRGLKGYPKSKDFLMLWASDLAVAKGGAVQEPPPSPSAVTIRTIVHDVRVPKADDWYGRWEKGWIGRVLDPLEAASERPRSLDPALGAEADGLVGIWESSAGVGGGTELRVQLCESDTEGAMRVFACTLRDPEVGLLVGRSRPAFAAAAAELSLSAKLLAEPEGTPKEGEGPKDAPRRLREWQLATIALAMRGPALEARLTASFADGSPASASVPDFEKRWTLRRVL